MLWCYFTCAQFPFPQYTNTIFPRHSSLSCTSSFSPRYLLLWRQLCHSLQTIFFRWYGAAGSVQLAFLLKILSSIIPFLAESLQHFLVCHFLHQLIFYILLQHHSAKRTERYSRRCISTVYFSAPSLLRHSDHWQFWPFPLTINYIYNLCVCVIYFDNYSFDMVHQAGDRAWAAVCAAVKRFSGSTVEAIKRWLLIYYTFIRVSNNGFEYRDEKSTNRQNRFYKTNFSIK